MKLTETMSNGSFFEDELAKMEREAYLDALQVDEYKRSFAESLKGVKAKSVLSETELVPKPRKKPFGMRLHEFFERIKNTL